MDNANQRGLIIRTSRFSHAATHERLTAAIARHGATVFAVIDHAANAASVGLELTPTTVVVFGNPAVGTPLMCAEPNLALDLPSRVLLRDNKTGTVEVVYLDPVVLAKRHGLSEDEVAGLSGLSGIVDDVLRHQ